MTAARTLFDKLWDAHQVVELAPGIALLHIDRHYIHDLQSQVFETLARRGLQVRNPTLTLCVVDHGVSTLPSRQGNERPDTALHALRMRRACAKYGIAMLDANAASQGIIHVVGPELGLTQPGMAVACGDSHTSTQGAFGALAFGIGTTEIVHVLATQTVCLRRPPTMCISINGEPARGVEAKDVALALVGTLGTAGATGYAVEYAGQTVSSMDMESRMTLCNLSIELGANIGLIAPDDTTFEFLKKTHHAPQGQHWNAAVKQWRKLTSDPGAQFDRKVTIDATTIRPRVSWGTSPEQTITLDERLPRPEQAPHARRAELQAALDYMGLVAGRPLAGTPIDHVFIGSCANGRLSDLRRAAAIVAGHKVAPWVAAWVVPGSQQVKRAAEAEGLDHVFREAGFEWRMPGCSMCVGVNGEILKPRQRCISTSNRNFVGRQGPGARTHLAGAAVAARAAILGHIPNSAEMEG